MSIGGRLKSPTRRLLRRAGYTLFKHRPPRNFAVPLAVETAAHRLLLRALLDRLSVNCVIDVGANTGEYATELREAGYRGEIVSLEPAAEAFAILKRRAEADPGWQVHQLALGRAPGEGRLQVARQSNFSSFLRPTLFSLEWFGGSAVEREERVEVRRLDAVFERLTHHVTAPRLLLKTDTQGWDLQVIEGAGRRLEQVVALQIELSVRAIYEDAPGWLDALAWLEDHDFRPVHMTSVTRDASLGVVEFDCLMIRAGEGRHEEEEG